jgi:osmotically-inducible protein OsmY
MLFAGFALASAPAADPSSAPPATSDIVLARTALTALDADRLLREVNLLVSVVDRVAVIGGPVASAEMAKRAESLVRSVPGIVEVKNRCYVQEGSDPLLRAMSDRLPPSPRRILASELPGIVASPKTGLVEEYAPALGENDLAAVVPTEKSVVALRPMNPSASVLLPPVGSSASVSAKASAPVVGVLASRPADVLAAAEAARNADRRFTGLKVSFANGTMVIAGTAARASDGWDLAQALRRIPGITRVVIGAVDVK